MTVALRYHSFVCSVALAIIVSATLFFGHIYAQTTPEKPDKNKPEKSKAEQPLELPEFVITGIESLDVPGGAKQSPKPAQKLTPQQISRFNPLDKQAFTLLPAPQISRPLMPQQEKNGFVKGEFGMFITPSLEAGYRAIFGNFDLNTTAGFILSSGHRRNADFNDVNASIESSYLAPEKFFFFGGSRTDTRISVNNRHYKYFGADSIAFPETVPERSVLNVETSLQTVGSFENWQYDMGASVESALLSGIHENTLIDGYIMAKTSLGAFLLGGKADVHLQATTNRPFAQIYRFAPSLLIGYNTSLLSISTEMGAHLASEQSIFFNSPIRPSASVQINVAANELLSIEFNGFTGIRPNSFLHALRLNPYIASTYTPMKKEYLFETILYDISATIRIHTSQYVHLNLGGSIEALDNAMVFDRSPQNMVNGEFSQYAFGTRIVRLFAETVAQVTQQDYLTARINARFGEIFANLAPLPLSITYLSPFDGSLLYRRQWLPQLSSQVECIYVAARRVQIFDTTLLPSYFDLRLNADYQINNAFSVYVRGTNLLNQPIFLWQGYQERGIFIAAGFVVTF